MKNQLIFSGKLAVLGLILAGCGTQDIQKINNPEEVLSFNIKAPSYRTYNTNFAVKYAVDNYNKVYSKNQNPFPDYSVYEIGGNCTNFVSQALLAGFTGETTPIGAYNKRSDFIADANSPYAWFFLKDGTPSSTTRGKAWASANELYKYAKSNLNTYKGLHFQYITNDTLTSFMDYKKVSKGDIIFADWTGDGRIDHSMIVSNTKFDDWFLRGYDRIRVTYQSSNKTDVGLGYLNELYNKKALFYVYRPIDYNPIGK